MNFNITVMTEDHIDDLVSLENICFAHPWTKNDFLDELRNESAHFLVAVKDSQVLGYIGVQEIFFEGYVTNIAVFPAFRRNGIAQALLEKACSDAMMRRCEFLTLEVRENNFSARSLYEKLGFISVGERKSFYRDPTETAILMSKSFKN